MIAHAALLALLGAGLSFAADPFVGTWKPNPDKWRASAGAPESRKHDLIKWEAVAKDHYRSMPISPDGTPGVTVDLFLDGKEHPVGDGDMASVRRLSDKHISISVKGPKGATTMDYIVSADGKTLTVNRKGVGTKSGRVIDEIHEYDKQ
jgi:hypothetical protein